MSEERTVERFKKRTVWLHWIHTLAFLILLVTGGILLIPGMGGAAAGGITRLIHRITVVFFVGAPVIYFIRDPKMSLHFIRESFTWGIDDIRWVSKAPDYYFGGNEDDMPPQGHINTGQKMWQFIIIATSVIFLITGIIMWFFKEIVPAGLFQWSVVLHDFAFILAALMLLVHIYLGVVHPRMTESLKSMIDGKISRKYARNHYGKWYDEMTAGETKPEQEIAPASGENPS